MHAVHRCGLLFHCSRACLSVGHIHEPYRMAETIKVSFGCGWAGPKEPFCNFFILFICQNVTYIIHSNFHNATGRTDWSMYRTYVLHLLGRSLLDDPRGKGNFGPTVCRSYSVGGSSSAAFYCQYCSSLLSLHSGHWL